MIADDTIMYHVQQTASYLEEDELKASYNEVSDWIKNPNAGESMILEASSPMIEYLIQKELRIRFLNIWTEPKNKKVRIIYIFYSWSAQFPFFMFFIFFFLRLYC